MGSDRAERHVVVPFELLSDLWRYGNINRVDGVLYGKSHADRLKEADDILCKALSAAPLVQMEAVAWRWRWNDGQTWMLSASEPDDDGLRIIEPLYASPVPSSERDDIIEMCARVADARARDASDEAERENDDSDQSILQRDRALASASTASGLAFRLRSLKSQSGEEST